MYEHWIDVLWCFQGPLDACSDEVSSASYDENPGEVESEINVDDSSLAEEVFPSEAEERWDKIRNDVEQFVSSVRMHLCWESFESMATNVIFFYPFATVSQCRRQ